MTMTIFLTICATMIGTAILIVALLVGGIEMLYEKIEKEKNKK